jgi:uncharacterized protein GlcG (DUF336 family)
VRASEILADGIRLPFANGAAAPGGSGAGGGTWLVLPTAGAAVDARAGHAGRRRRTRRPALPDARGREVLSAADVAAVLDQAASQSAKTRAAIRQPLGSSARVSIAVVDTTGAVLGFFQTGDAPNFGLDVSVQKARTAAFFSSESAGLELSRAGLSAYLASDVPLDGRYAYTSRAIGFLAQPFYPPGIGGAGFGPFSLPIDQWSPFDTGLQLDMLNLAGAGSCSAIARLPNGITIFPGGIPLFKDGRLAGAVGVSGDGVDQDDLIAAAGGASFEVPPEKRSDQLVVRGDAAAVGEVPAAPGALSGMRRGVAGSLALALLALAALVAADEVLVLKDGRKIPVTRLARRDGQVVFQTTRGEVFSVPEGDVVSPPARLDPGRREQSCWC